MTIHQHRLGLPGRWRSRSAALLVGAAGMAACTEPITSPEPSERPSFAAGGLAVASARVLPLLPGASGQYSSAVDANDLGQVVGFSSSPTTLSAPVVWDAADTPTELPGLALNQPAEANAISEDGTIIVGYSHDGTTYQPARWIRTGAFWVVDALPIPLGIDYCVAYDTNADGSLIVGTCYITSIQYSSVVVWRSGFPQTLGAGTGTGVNESGQVVGYSDNGQGVLWTLSGGFLNLGTLGGLKAFPQAINESGDVVGTSEIASSTIGHAFLWTERKGMVELGGFDSHSAAIDVNDAGQAVGYGYVDAGGGVLSEHAVLWAKGKVLDLGVPLGYSQSSARSITNSGKIVGQISFPGTRAVVWQLR